MNKITIIGAGFAALSAVRQLRKQDKEAEITLIAPRAELHYLPGIIWIPSGIRKREDLIVPLGNFFSRSIKGLTRWQHLLCDRQLTICRRQQYLFVLVFYLLKNLCDFVNNAVYFFIIISISQ